MFSLFESALFALTHPQLSQLYFYVFVFPLLLLSVAVSAIFKTIRISGHVCTHLPLHSFAQGLVNVL